MCWLKYDSNANSGPFNVKVVMKHVYFLKRKNVFFFLLYFDNIEEQKDMLLNELNMILWPTNLYIFIFEWK